MLGIGLVLLIAAASLLYFNQDKIISLVVSQLNERLLAPVQVDEVEISWQKFPRAAVKMNSVFSAGLPATQSDTLLYAEEVFLAFNLWAVFTGDISVEEVSLEHGTLSLITNAQGLSNYDILNTQEAEAEESSGFRLEAFYLKDIRVTYKNQQQQLALQGHCPQLNAKGQFNKEVQIGAQLDAVLHHYQQQGQSYVQQPVQLAGRMDLQNSQNNLLLNGENVTINQNLVLNFSYVNQAQKHHLFLESQETYLEDLLPLAQEQAWLNLQTLSAAGPLKAQASLDLLPNEPLLKVTFSGDDTQLNWSEHGRLETLDFSGQYQYQGGADQLEITELTSRTSDQSIRGSALIKNLERPQVTANLEANMPLEQWTRALGLDTLENVAGQLQAQLQLAGQFAKFGAITQRELAQSSLKGQLKIGEGAFNLKGSSQQVNNLQGELSLEDKKLLVNGLYLTSHESDLYLKGTLTNTLNYLFFNDEKLAVNVLVKSQEVVLDTFLQNQEGSNPGTYSLAFTQNLNVSLQLEIDRFAFAEFKAQQIKGLLEIQEGKITGNQLSMKAQEGSYQGEFSLSPIAQKGYFLEAQLKAQRINMRALFAGFQNFSQQTLTANNLVGTAWINTRLNARLDSTLQIDPYSLVAQNELRIIDGHLKNYEPMKALSRFAEIEELEDVAFSELSNVISINNGLITIPSMDIKSNVLDLQLQGTHSFENEIDYLVKLRLSDVLFKDRKSKTNPEFEDHLSIAQRDDDHRIPVSITGTTDAPQIKVTGKDIGQSLGEDLKKQGQELKEIFKKEPKKKEKTGIIYEWDGG